MYELERVSGVSRSVISKLERGQRPALSLQTALDLARALGVSLDYLAGRYADEDDDAPDPEGTSATAALIGVP
jgi:transcriptional regulator with XRE-family HTH domain